MSSWSPYSIYWRGADELQAIAEGRKRVLPVRNCILARRKSRPAEYTV